MKQILLTIAFTLLFVSGFVNAQSIDKISKKCLPPNQSTFSTVAINNPGDVTLTPCVGRSVIFPSGTIVSGVVTGSGTTNFIPRWTGASVLGNTPNSWNGTTYAWSDTALTATGTMSFVPASTVNGTKFFAGTTNFGLDLSTVAGGNLTIGDPANFSGFNYVATSGTASITSFGTTGTNGVVVVGSSNNASAGRIDVNRGTNTVSFFTTTIDLSTGTVGNANHVSNIKLPRTNTAAGTTGAQTINQVNGSVNFAAAATTLVVTDSVAIAGSNIIATAQTNDTTCAVKNVVTAAGSFTITMTAACTAETRVAFWVFN